jgi:hypothetical protein
MPAETVEIPYLSAVSGGADTAIRVSTAAVVLAVAGIAAYISYWHAYAVVRQYGESGVTAMLEPGTIDGLVLAVTLSAHGPASFDVHVPAGLGVDAVPGGWSVSAAVVAGEEAGERIDGFE